MADDDRKYRQRGYQDSGERRQAPSRGPQAPRPKPDGPRGRGLGAPTEAVFRCSACGAKQMLGGEAGGAGGAAATGEAAAAPPAMVAVAPDAVCSKCGADLHSCSNCISFDTASRWECRRVAELPARVAKKRAKNDCTLFHPKMAQEFGADRDKPAAAPDDPRAAFDALFKN